MNKKRRLVSLFLSGMLLAGGAFFTPLMDVPAIAAATTSSGGGGPKFMGNILTRTKNSKTMDDNTKGFLNDIATWGFLVVILAVLVTGIGGLVLRDKGHEGAANVAFGVSAGILLLSAVALFFDSMVPVSAIPGRYPVAMNREAIRYLAQMHSTNAYERG